MYDLEEKISKEKDGQYILVNPAKIAFNEAQKAFEGEAERLGLKDLNDVVSLVKEIRAERKQNQ